MYSRYCDSALYWFVGVCRQGYVQVLNMVISNCDVCEVHLCLCFWFTSTCVEGVWYILKCVPSIPCSSYPLDAAVPFAWSSVMAGIWVLALKIERRTCVAFQRLGNGSTILKQRKRARQLKRTNNGYCSIGIQVYGINWYNTRVHHQ